MVDISFNLIPSKSLDTCCLTKLKNPAPNLNLYQSVQRVMEKLLDKVKDKIWGVEFTGIMIDLVLTLLDFYFQGEFGCNILIESY